MTIQGFLADATATLRGAGIESARLDNLILLEDALKLDRAAILAHPDDLIPEATLRTLQAQLMERCRQTPLAYIRGKAAFYGRDFIVTPDVLVPRPETETMITLLLALHLPARVHIADVGTGSGCLGITAALELPHAVVDAYDCSEPALTVARKNANLHRVSIRCHMQDLLPTLTRPHDIILANLPYVPDSYPVNPAARHEPGIALFAGPDGLDLYRELFAQLAPGNHYLLTEALPEQHGPLKKLAAAHSYTLHAAEGLIQVFERV